MKTVRLNKDELEVIVRKNRDKHRKIFEEAIEGYRKRVIKRLEQMVQNAKDGKKVDTYVNMVQPEDHTKDYNQVLEMLELSVDDTIELSHQDFARYVQDRWEWSGKFANDSVSYVSSVTADLLELE